MRHRMLIGLGIAIVVSVAMLGCGDKPSESSAANAKPEPNVTRAAIMEKMGTAFKVQWSWSSTTPGTAQVVLTVTPTRAGQSLKIQARLPQGVGLVGGELNRTLTTPSADIPVKLEFQIGFALNIVPLIPVDILLVVGTNDQSASTVVIHDPAVPVPEPSETPGIQTNVGGFPAKVVGEAVPAKRKDDK